MTRMAYRRIEMGFTQEELGRILGISHSLVSLIERRKYQPSPILARKIAEVLGHTIQELLAPVQIVSIAQQLYLAFKECEQGHICFREQIKQLNARGETWLDECKPLIDEILPKIRKELRRREQQFRQDFGSA